MDEKTYKTLKTENIRTPNFYILPKIHKELCPGRPILSANGCPTEKISGYIDAYINPLVQQTPSYIKDTTHFLQLIHEIQTPLPENTLLVTLDVSSLYTNIPHDETILAVKETMKSKNLNPNLIKWISKLLSHVLTKNAFQFNEEIYLQTRGTAMGTIVAPASANLFMNKLETKALHDYPLKPLIWKRFIDDIFCIWTHGEKELIKFFTYLNQLHQTIKFTYEYSAEHITFLDTTVHYLNKELYTDLFCKKTDLHGYLHYHSAHPDKCKTSSPYSQILRIKRICTHEIDFIKHQYKLVHYYKQRGYPLSILLENIKKAQKINRQDLLYPQNKIQKVDTKPTRIPLVLTYHPVNPPLVKIINKYWYLLEQSSAPDEFTNKPIIAYKRLPNIKDQVVKAKW